MATLAVAMAQAAPGAAEIPAGAVARTMVAAAEVVRRVQPTEDSEHRRAGVIDYARMRGWRNFGGSFGSWNSDLGGKMDANLVPSLLEEFKSNKSRSYELSEIAGHVVEFSADQYGSRFIQQKLETASTEEKDMVFAEIMPQSLTLMTDVFGNYVVQKFFLAWERSSDKGVG